MVYIVVVGGPRIGTVHPVDPKGCKIGRGLASSKHLSIEKDEYISRRGEAPETGSVRVGEVAHAEVASVYGHWYVRDINSKGGVLVVDGTNVVQLIKGGDKALGHARLFECGHSMFLFLDTGKTPPAVFVQAACSTDQAPQLSGEASHTGIKDSKSTLTLPNPQSEVPVLIARWQTIMRAMRQHGLGALLDG